MRPSTETSLARALRVLAAVFERREVGADALARDLGVPLSTVYRYLRDLRSAGFVDEADGTYVPGAGLSRPAGTLPSPTELRRLARPTLEWLAAETDETSLIVIRSGTHALCLDQVESAHAMHLAFKIGQQLPLHAGAASRVLLAYAPPSVVADVFTHLKAFTPATPDAASLVPRLEAIRRTGFATSRGEFIAEAVAIACPILRGDNCLCSIAIAAPARRAGAAWQRRAKDCLATARRTIASLV